MGLAAHRQSLPEASGCDEDLSGLALRETYRLLRPLGRGGMSVVYEALHLRLGHTVAVKLMARELAADRHALSRFRREAELLVELRHPNVVQVIDFDVTARGEPYIVMERLEGQSLADRLDQERALPVQRAALVVSQLASALAFAHLRGILHRDLKPTNVFLSQLSSGEPHAKLLDFGIAKRLVSEPGLTLDCMVGTPEYMAPEQATPWAEIDHRADQYALALLAYEMISGTQPFWDGDVVQVLHSVRVQNRPKLSEVAPGVPAAVAAVIERGMSRHCADRYADVTELAAALQDAARGPERAPMVSGARFGRVPALAGDAEALAQEVEAALMIGDVTRAYRSAELACWSIAPDALESISPLLEEALLARLGGPRGRVRRRATNAALSNSDVTPHDAFVLSRVEEGMAVDDLLDVSALPRREALRSIARLFERGFIALI